MDIQDLSHQLATAGVGHFVVIAGESEDLQKQYDLMVKTRRAIDDANTAVNSGRIGDKTFKAMKKAQSLVQKLGKAVGAKNPGLSYDAYCDDMSAYKAKLISSIKTFSAK